MGGGVKVALFSYSKVAPGAPKIRALHSCGDSCGDPCAAMVACFLSLVIEGAPRGPAPLGPGRLPPHRSCQRFLFATWRILVGVLNLQNRPPLTPYSRYKAPNHNPTP